MIQALEQHMLQILLTLKNNHQATHVRGEFEAEGLTVEDFLILQKIALKSGLDLAIKIGGCEALSDLKIAHQLGANLVVAPMIESPFALAKYLHIISNTSTNNHVKYLINIETTTGYQQLDAILDSAGIEQLLGIVIGRVDLSQSLGYKDRSAVDGEPIFKICQDIAQKAQSKNLLVFIGGGMSVQSQSFLKRLHPHISGFETRKIVFAHTPYPADKQAQSISLATQFEVLWLQHKQARYQQIVQEDCARLDLLTQRLNQNMNH